MTTTNQLMVDRLSQGAAATSAAVSVSSQRVYTALELMTALAEMTSFWNFINGLRLFALNYRAGNSSMYGATKSTTFSFHAAAGQAVAVAPSLVLTGGFLAGGHYSEASPMPTTVAIPGSSTKVGRDAVGAFRLTLDGVTLSEFSCPGQQVLPYLFRLPQAVYQTVGGFVEQIASGILRSDLSHVVVSPAQRVALNRVVAGELKTAVSDVAGTVIGNGATILIGGALLAGRQQADLDAPTIVAARFPRLYATAVLHEGLGDSV